MIVQNQMHLHLCEINSGDQRRRVRPSLGVILALLAIVQPVLTQERGGRDAVPPKSSAKTGTPKGPRRSPPKPKLASLSITISPPDSILIFDEQQSDKVDASGSAQFTRLKPGQHTLTVRHEGYREKQETIGLQAGENGSISITLDLLKGTLSVSPGVPDTTIELRSVVANQSVGLYSGAINQVEFPPGEYEITVTRRGYKTVNRRFTIKAAESVYLEPQLELLAPPKPRVSSMTALVQVQDKNLIVDLQGSTGDTSRGSGLITVGATKATPNVTYVSGALNGLPCAIDLLRLDNVAESSIFEFPGPSNEWSKIVVRIRPKDSKRQVRFAISWKSLAP